MNKEKIKGVLITLALLISILANVYYFGTQELNKERQKYFDAGANDVSAQIVKSLNENGNLTLNIEGKQTVLIPQQ